MSDSTAWSSEWLLSDETATETLGAALAQCCRDGGLVFLHGPLGAGKTTTARGLLRALGHEGKVKSPTYTLVEPYESLSPVAYHFDLYRLNDPEELEFMGFRDFLRDDALCLIEWPEKGAGWLGTPDLELELEPTEEARLVRYRPQSRRGAGMAEALKQLLMSAKGVSAVQSSRERANSTGKSDDV